MTPFIPLRLKIVHKYSEQKILDSGNSFGSYFRCLLEREYAIAMAFEFPEHFQDIDRALAAAKEGQS